MTAPPTKEPRRGFAPQAERKARIDCDFLAQRLRIEEGVVVRLTRELEDLKKYEDSYKESMHEEVNYWIKKASALREVVEAASVVASCWNTQDDKAVVVRYPKAEEVRRYFTAWDALAAPEEGKP